MPGHAEAAVAPRQKRCSVELVRSAACHDDGVGWPVELGARSVRLDAILLHGVKAGRPCLDTAGVAVVERHTVLVEFERGIA